jgi:hypothetical protein
MISEIYVGLNIKQTNSYEMQDCYEYLIKVVL